MDSLQLADHIVEHASSQPAYAGGSELKPGTVGGTFKPAVHIVGDACRTL